MTRDEAIGQIFNTRTGQETSMNELLRCMKRALNMDIPVEYRPRRDWDHIARRRSDITNITRKLGYKTTVELEAGLRQTVDWFQQNDIRSFRMYN